MQKANKLKEVKAEKRTSMKKNTRSKEENQHEEEYSIKRSRRRKARTMSKLHPQHFLFRPPVVGLDMYWNLYRKDWEEKYFVVFATSNFLNSYFVLTLVFVAGSGVKQCTKEIPKCQSL